MAQWAATQLASTDVVAYLNLDQAGLEAQIQAMLAINPAVKAAERTSELVDGQAAGRSRLEGEG